MLAENSGQAEPPCGAALRRAAFNLLLFGCRNSGAAFIKWGQWASSRPDLLPEVTGSQSAMHFRRVEFLLMQQVCTLSVDSAETVTRQPLRHMGCNRCSSPAHCL